MRWAILCVFGSLAANVMTSLKLKHSLTACVFPTFWLTVAMTVMICWLSSLSIRLPLLFHRVATVNNRVNMTIICTVTAIWLSAFSTKSSTIVACFLALINSVRAILAFCILSLPAFGYVDMSTQPSQSAHTCPVVPTQKFSRGVARNV